MSTSTITISGTEPVQASESQRKTTKSRTRFDCDICGSDQAAEIEIARQYTDGQPLHVCKSCGFVYVRERRSSKEIADSWSNDIFESQYTARIPAVLARHMYVAEFIETEVRMRGKRLCDIGAGEGQFLGAVGEKPYSAAVFGLEPSQKNVSEMRAAGIEAYAGSIEDYIRDPVSRTRRFDIVTILWTLENCQSCKTMLDAAHQLTSEEGYVVVATGSRILVPFKKPLHYYLGTRAADTHAFRFSANTLRGALAESGFRTIRQNRCLDTEYLCAIGKKVTDGATIEWPHDDYKDVLHFFGRWHKETQDHYANV